MLRREVGEATAKNETGGAHITEAAARDSLAERLQSAIYVFPLTPGANFDSAAVFGGRDGLEVGPKSDQDAAADAREA